MNSRIAGCVVLFGVGATLAACSGAPLAGGVLGGLITLGLGLALALGLGSTQSGCVGGQCLSPYDPPPPIDAGPRDGGPDGGDAAEAGDGGTEFGRGPAREDRLRTIATLRAKGILPPDLADELEDELS